VAPRKGVTLSATKTKREESTIFLTSSEFNFTAFFEDEQLNNWTEINNPTNKYDRYFAIFFVFMIVFFSGKTANIAPQF
jgi:hypothetical protein